MSSKYGVVSAFDLDPPRAEPMLPPRGLPLAQHPVRPSVERVTDEERVRASLQALAASNAPAIARVGFRAPSSIAPPRVVDGELVWSSPVARNTAIEITGFNSVYRFVTEAEGTRTPVPRSIVRVRRRWERRLSLEAHDELTFERWRMRDLSYGGVSFWFDPRQDAFEAGTILSDARVIDDLDRPIRLDAQVRAIELDAERALCRARVAPRTREDDVRWANLVDARLHPSTHSGAQWAPELWALYDRCGYFNLSGKEPQEFEALRGAFITVAEALDRAPRLGVHVVHPSVSTGVTAALSMLKVYSRAWLGFQMAKVKGQSAEGISSRDVLRDIHLRAYEHAQRDPELGWLIGYAQVKPVWTRAVHLAMPDRYVDSGEAVVVRFQALEIASKGEGAGPVGPATQAETARFLSMLARTRPAAYCEGLDLTPSTIGLGANVAAWRAVGLARERAVLAARRGRGAVAIAVLELGQDGAHLFRLLDLVRLYALEEGGEELFPALLEEAGRWYAARGKPSFILFREPEVPLDARVAVLRDLGEADMSILSAALLPELLEQVYEVTAPRTKETSNEP